MTRETQFRVEKFIPTQCPMCRNSFRENSDEGFLLGTYWRHLSVDVVQTIAQSIASHGLRTDLVLCGKCKNVTLRVVVEERTFDRREEAEAAVCEGFANLQEAETLGGEVSNL